jgi:hypothetical protein
VVTLFFALWYAGPAVKALAAYRLWRNGLIQRFPTVWSFLVVSAAVSVSLIAFRRNPAIYNYVYAYSTPITLLAQTFAVVGIFWTVAEYYPAFRKPGTALLTALALIGALASWLTRFVAVPAGWSGAWQAATLIQRHLTLVMSIVLLGTGLLLPRVRGIPIRPSAARAAYIVTFHSILCSAGTALTVATRDKYPMLMAFIAVAGGLITALLFAICLSPASDQCPEPVPVSEEELDDLMKLHERNWELLRELSAGRLKHT